MPHVFIYGPDSVQARIYDRIGPSDVVGGAVLAGHALTFNKPNMKNESEGLANLTPAADQQVYGVLYDLSPKQLETLDGYYGGYGRKRLEVELVLEDRREKRTAETWVARRTKAGLKPTRGALDLAIRGAKENGAPASFLDALAKQETL